MRVFGKASDFYRLRILKVAADSELELDWREDILLRSPPPAEQKTNVWHILQAVRVDSDQAFSLKMFPDREAAAFHKDEINELLQDLTKQEFEDLFDSVDFKDSDPGDIPT